MLSPRLREIRRLRFGLDPFLLLIVRRRRNVANDDRDARRPFCDLRRYSGCDLVTRDRSAFIVCRRVASVGKAASSLRMLCSTVV